MFRTTSRDPRETLKGLADEFSGYAGDARYKAAQMREQHLMDQNLQYSLIATTWEKAERIVRDRISVWDTLGPPPAA